MLELYQVRKHFGGLRAVDDVSFTVDAGCIKGVIGPNGAGKSTLFNLIACNIPLSSGTIRFDNREIQRLKPYQTAELGFARTFQNIKLFADMSVLECVMVGAHSKGRAGFLAGMLPLPQHRREEAAIRRKSMECLEFLGIADLAESPAEALAFGQQRAVELARALAAEPRLLLLDEPAAGLNIYETAELGRLIKTIREQGVTVLLVEHDMSLVMDICDEIVVLSSGRKLAEDIPSRIQHNAEVIAIYLGEDYEPAR
ncbi:MAG: ABC transporter ATP-binding protein [Desulfobulbaceae bacterium]|nr:ABC transporter ATP-binding protein [Desulfobulbaceae bacterium]